MNFWGFTPAVFSQLRAAFRQFLDRSGVDLKSECYIPTVVAGLVAASQARVKVLRTEDPWLGVTYREDRPRVTAGIAELIRCGSYPEKLWQ